MLGNYVIRFLLLSVDHNSSLLLMGPVISVAFDAINHESELIQLYPNGKIIEMLVIIHAILIINPVVSR